jgi:hypothetical protein
VVRFGASLLPQCRPVELSSSNPLTYDKENAHSATLGRERKLLIYSHIILEKYWNVGLLP